MSMHAFLYWMLWFAWVWKVGRTTRVEVTLNAGWESTSLVAETAEFLWREDPSAFWNFVERWHSKDQKQQNCSSVLQSVTEDLISAELQRYLSIVLSLRLMSPKVDLKRQLPKIHPQTCCWIEHHAHLKVQDFTDDPNDLSILMKFSFGEVEDVIFDFDFEYGGLPGSLSNHGRKDKPYPVFLYGPIGSSCFPQLHGILKGAAEKGRIRYVFRPVLDSSHCSADELHDCADFGQQEKLKLGGFGAELALKSTEYSAINEASNTSSNEATSTLEAENVSFQNLGLQTTQSILESTDPLTTFTEMVQDFPSHAATLSKIDVEKDIGIAVAEMARIVSPEQDFALLNGIPIDLEDLDLVDLLDDLHRDLVTREKLKKMPFSDEEVLQLLKLRAQDATRNLETVRFDILPKEQVIYFNDVEKDAAYRNYPSSLDILFSPFIRTSLIPIRRNLFNAVFFVDMMSKAGIKLAEFLLLLYEQKASIRMGIVPIVPDLCQAQMGEIQTDTFVHYFLGLYFTLGPNAALRLWSAAEPSASVWEPAYVRVFESFAKKQSSYDKDPLESLKSVSSKIQEYIEHLHIGFRKLGVCNLNGQAWMWLNGRMIELDGGALDRTILYHIQLETRFLQQLVYMEEISDADKDLTAAILDNQFTFSKYSAFVLATPPRIADLALDERHFAEGISFVADPDENSPTKTVTHWIVGHFASRVGLSVVRSALEFILSPDGEKAQVAFLPTFESCSLFQLIWNHLSPKSSDHHQAEIFHFWIHLLSNSHIVDALLNEDVSHKLLIKSQIVDFCQTIQCPFDNVDDLLEATGCHLDPSDVVSFPGLNLETHRALAVVSNGRVVFPAAHCEEDPRGEARRESVNSLCGLFTAEDFVILQIISEDYQLAEILDSFLSSFKHNVSSKDYSQRIATTASILRKHSVSFASDTMRLQKVFGRLNKRIMFVNEADSAAFEMEMLLNPVSVTAQRFVPVLHFLRSVFQIKMSIFLHTRPQLLEMPLQQYYRMAFPAIDSRDGLSGTSTPRALFENVPGNKILTLNPETPSAWLIEPTKAEMDLDNLRLMDVKGDGLSVEYGLESILLTGSCVDTTARSRRDVYPRGLQLKLGRDKSTDFVDTLVMSNLGYFQLKANPGMWHLSLAEGRSKELYFMDPQMKEDKTLQFASADSQSTSLCIVMDSFSGRHLRLNVMKRPGHEAEDVLDVPSEDTSAPNTSPLLDKVLQWAGIEKPRHGHNREEHVVRTDANWQGCEFPDDPVNVFTIASGHMYERLQKIMILSVLRHTKSCVKFWFIKNYMSPQIKEFLPHFAKKYKFEYGLITYKWPLWLQHQTEKQRKIWAYKILFLDVLFPSHVRKVLFLDSDQIIRTDIRNLYDMDIQGAPLAYTPFCDNNKEMDGFRFWKQGFWESHLQGKPYHISALYVVDLVKFRQMAAGDHLRVVYEQLSKDPNSLANLDQDLPNYTQHQVPIFSLPQEWLWCESWCGNETKHAAKTIDLCNNPLTKEPKLQSARRIVSEWTELDNEAHQLTLEVEKQHLVTPINEAKRVLISEHDRTEL